LWGLLKGDFFSPLFLAEFSCASGVQKAADRWLIANDNLSASQFNVDNLAEELLKHPDRHFVRYLLDGIKIGFRDESPVGSFLHARCFILILFAKYSFLTFEIHDLCLNLQSFHLHVP
jgi:hypothetical protein